ncbi:stage V sporulation protein AB [Paenibacillus agricola]|uniref:Stage V sporulation protein AB n=1 Tax=Paenibacillus agricola TaxID=2716264 RepID=A0ABX0J446_9BACL|nr:stage V sporulation protein AB [Paenibacillus agricola]NHN28779.1 stage V sporulation protein AB [Paenibacillus agricola]
MSLWWQIPAQIIIGLAGGIAVGSGMVAFLVALDIIPRLAQITRSYRLIRWYEWSVVVGSLFFTLSDFFEWSYSFHPLLAVFFGLLAGIFIGMLAGALTEIMNVLPILAKRVGMASYMVWLLMAMVFGKIIGSLMDWLHIIG